MSALDFRTARALFPHQPEMWQPEYLYEPLPLPVEHPELDLFGKQRLIDEESGIGAEGLTPEGVSATEAVRMAEPMKARMMNEFVYCPRLFYYEHVEGVFLDNADTERGSAIHEKVDRGRGSLPRARKKKKPTDEAEDAGEVSATEQAEAMAAGEPGTESLASAEVYPPANIDTPNDVAPEVEVIHSRSAMMGSERLGVVAKMDVIEVEMAVIPQQGWTREDSGHPLRGCTACPQEVEKPADDLTKKATAKNRRKGGNEEPDLFSLAARQDLPQEAVLSPTASISPQANDLNPTGNDDAGLTNQADKSSESIQKEILAPSCETAGGEAPALLHVRLNEHVVQRVTPVDYKAGSPRIGEDRNELWDADKMQLGLQILILRDNGYACDEGVIYYRGTKQRVSMPMTPEIESWIIDKLAEARRVAASEVIPPPLVHSPKCVRCSLAPVCLPDETRLLKRDVAFSPEEEALTEAGKPAPPVSKTTRIVIPPRRLIAARDDERALYLNTQGHRVGIKSERLIIKDGESEIDTVRLSDVTHVALFGNIQITTQAIQELCRQEIPLAYFSQSGFFYGITRGHVLTNVHTRIRQFATAGNPLQCLILAKKMVQAKIRNHRTMLMRLHTQAPQTAVTGMKEIGHRVAGARGLDELLGHEGAAAALYFQHFAGMIKVGEEDLEDEIPGLDISRSTETRRLEEKEVFTFDFTHRNRRPPKDPVNALLSLAYSLLAKDCTIAALAVGFDPYVGFYHQPRQGRPALALDLMEEFRPLIAESAVLTAINNRMVTPGHFVRAGDAVNLTKHGRKAFFHAYEQRMNSLITHPVFDYKVSYRRVLELQARLLARWLTGEIPDYIPMMTR